MNKLTPHLPPLRILTSRVALLILAGSLTACAGMQEKLSRVGQAPALNPITNPTTVPNYTPVSMPMPNDGTPSTAPSASLWQPGSRTFFKDNRASRVGDILTVDISINEGAKMTDHTQATRDSSNNAGLSGLFGLNDVLDKVLPAGYKNSTAVGTNSDISQNGAGSINRNEKINLTVAAVVTQVLPNGNLVVQGHQEVRVNNEVRELLVAGIVRPADISATNTIQHTQMAQARISYGGRGDLSDVQQARYGQQVLDTVLPW